MTPIADRIRHSWRAAFRRWADRWIQRRGPSKPPLSLGYRQIFILPTGFGWIFGLITLAMLMGSLNFNNNLGLLTAFMVAGLAVNGMLVAFNTLHGLTIRHCWAAPVFAGEPARLRVSLANDDTRPRPGLSLRSPTDKVNFALDYDQNHEVDIPIPTSQRGWMHPPRLRIQTTQPLGLFEAWSWFWPEQPILVWPRPAQPAPPLPVRGGGSQGHRTVAEPQGEDFHSLRGWREGDPLHLVAWKQSQRHQALLSREFRQEQSEILELNLALAPGKDLEQRISVLTAWVLMAARDQRPWILDLGSESLGPGSDESHRNTCLRALAELPK
ncbi:MAG: DUF58 domain-containing protein [Wenzhouxiangella sp.]|nr:MAG: DUF58 domain-containing protein [Wenzhouxiangella sp.]